MTATEEDSPVTCPGCEGMLMVERREGDYLSLHTVSATERRASSFQLKLLQPLMFRSVEQDEILNLEIASCAHCSHRLRLGQLGRIDKSSSGIILHFPQYEDVNVSCTYCGNTFIVSRVSPQTLDIHVEPPASTSRDYQLEQFLNDKPVLESNAGSGCLATLLIGALFTLLWIL